MEAKLIWQKFTEMSLVLVLHQIDCVGGIFVLSKDSDFQMWLTTTVAHLCPTFAGKLCCSLSLLHWIPIVISNHQKQQQVKPWHQLVSVSWNVFWHFGEYFLVKLRKRNHIVSIVHHSEQKLLVRPNEDFVCDTLHLLQQCYSLCQAVPDWRHLTASVVVKSWIILLNPKSCFSILRSNWSEVSNSFAVFLLPRGFLFILFLTASLTPLLRSQLFLLGIGFGEVVCSFETFFHTLKTAFLQTFVSFINLQLFIPNIFNVTIWSPLFGLPYLIKL